MDKAVVICDLGMGDSGKGALTEALCEKLDADLVVRYSGGCQCAHNVVLPDGRHHTFAQFGSGTLSGVPTYLASTVIINPISMLRESEHLASLMPGRLKHDPMSSLLVHPDCLVVTAFARRMNRIREGTRPTRHGTCHQGIGETRSYWIRYGEDALRAEDLRSRRTTLRKLRLQRERFLAELSKGEGDHFALVEDGPDLASEADSMCKVAPLLYMCETLPNYRTVVFEGAQGVLLDEWWGFHPHTTWSDVTPKHALELARGCPDVKVIGVTRAFTTRHGAGPLPTESEELRHLSHYDHNPEGVGQGAMRWGHLDIPLLRYAARACGRLDGIAVSWLDHFEEGLVCVGYAGNPEIGPCLNLEVSERGTKQLGRMKPILKHFTRSQLLEEIDCIAPVVCEGYGPTRDDRSWRGFLS